MSPKHTKNATKSATKNKTVGIRGSAETIAFDSTAPHVKNNSAKS
jgi:hypothetical protein